MNVNTIRIFLLLSGMSFFAPMIEARTMHRAAQKNEAVKVALKTHVDAEPHANIPDEDNQDFSADDLAIEMEDHVGDQEEQELEEEQAVEKQTQIVPEEQFNEEAKRKAVVQLVEDGKSWFERNSEDKALSDFSHNKRFVNGELYLFVIDASKSNQGVVIAHGQDNTLIWQDLYNYRDAFGVYFIRELIDAARKGGGWVTYQWRNATKNAYVREVKRDGKSYIIGSGYYPHSKEDAVISMVKSAVALFNQLIAQGQPIEGAFSNFSYPIGRFVRGDLYLYALDFKGTHYAHGELPGLIGTNGWEYKDANGKLVNQEIVGRLQDKDFGTGIWVEYLSRNALKLTYAEKVKDREGRLYFIAAGYYPSADREHVVDLVKKGYQYMKASGKTVAAKAFSEKRNLQFRYGDLTLFVYDMKGMVIANGRDPEFVGENQINNQDENGTYYVQELIKKAQAGGGWVDIRVRNSYETAYVEKVDLGIEEFVIGCGFFPASKFETMTLIAKSGADYLAGHNSVDAFREFVRRDGAFIRGDLDLFVFDDAGICLVYGTDFDLIWRNILNINDDNGKPFVKVIINTARRGQGIVSFKLNGAMKTAYIIPVQKDDKMFVVGSSFYH